jgi:hypothetical protein
LQAQIAKAQEEVAAERAKQAEIDAEKHKAVPLLKYPTPGTGGLYSPATEQRRASQQQATRNFAFGPVTTNTPGDPITVDTLKNLKASDRSQVGLSCLGADLETVDGRRKLIQTLENPSFKGKIDEAAYDDLISTFDPKEVAAHRAEMKVEELSPTKQNQQAQTRAICILENLMLQDLTPPQVEEALAWLANPLPTGNYHKPMRNLSEVEMFLLNRMLETLLFEKDNSPLH